MGAGFRPKGAGSAYCKGCKERHTSETKKFNEPYCKSCQDKLKKAWENLKDNGVK